MAIPTTQTAVVQTTKKSADLPLCINTCAPVPQPPTEYHALVRVHAVALNPNDHKMITHFNTPESIAGCDFSGIVAVPPSASTLGGRFPPGSRVCGALFPYNPENLDNGSFAEYCAVDARILVKIPDDWSDAAAASLGVGWSTISLALSDPNALGLEGLPTKPTHTAKEPVLVYGGATASGTLACQMLQFMGYTPYAVASEKSAELAKEYGAVATAPYTSKDCVSLLKASAGKPIRYALDCITDAESAAICYGALARTGGTYACLEECPTAWRTRRVIKVKEVMGFQILGIDINLPGSTYTRPGDQALFEIGTQWAREMEALMESGRLKPHPVREIDGGWDAIIEGLGQLRKGEVRGQKLVVQIPQTGGTP